MRSIRDQVNFNKPRVRREVIDVPEKKIEDQSLQKLIFIRKQRLTRIEQECREARQVWRKARTEIGEAKERWRNALQESKDFWQESRKGFFAMAITSGQFRKAKAIYERMKAHAAQLHLECQEAVVRCKEKRTGFFEARKRVVEATLDLEKLGMLRDEIRLLTRQSEW